MIELWLILIYDWFNRHSSVIIISRQSYNHGWNFFLLYCEDSLPLQYPEAVFFMEFEFVNLTRISKSLIGVSYYPYSFVLLFQLLREFVKLTDWFHLVPIYYTYIFVIFHRFLLFSLFPTFSPDHITWICWTAYISIFGEKLSKKWRKRSRKKSQFKLRLKLSDDITEISFFFSTPIYVNLHSSSSFWVAYFTRCLQQQANFRLLRLENAENSRFKLLNRITLYQSDFKNSLFFD